LILTPLPTGSQALGWGKSIYFQAILDLLFMTPDSQISFYLTAELAEAYLFDYFGQCSPKYSSFIFCMNNAG